MKRFSASAARALLCATLVATAGGVATSAQAQTSHHHRHTTAAAACRDCGTVVSSRTYQREPERASGLGAVGGAVVGGLLGNQVGSGRGRTLATIAGAAGGGYAGNRVERNMHAQTLTDVSVRLADGKVRTFTEQGPARFRRGAHVRVNNGGLVSN
jgi:outer membrane lipoprotein SlyB